MANDLSSELRAHEIHEKANSYFRTSEQYGYKFLMELKIIRDEKLFKELGFSSFDQYTTVNFNYSQRTVNERIQSAEVWGQDYERALASYGKTKARQVAQLPEKERENAVNDGIPTDNGIKSLDEATTREISEYQKQLKQKDAEIEALKKREPEVIEKEIVKEVKVTPPDYENMRSDISQLSDALKSKQQELDATIKRNEFIENQYKEVLEDRKEDQGRKEKLEKIQTELERLAKRKNKMSDQIDTIKQLTSLKFEVDQILEKVSPFYFNQAINQIREDAVLEQSFMETIDSLQKWCDEMYSLLGKQNTFEGEIIND